MLLTKILNRADNNRKIDFFISHNTICFVCSIKLTTCFGPSFRPSSGHKIYVVCFEETILYVLDERRDLVEF